MPCIYSVKSATPVADWPSLLLSIFPAWAGEPAQFGGECATIAFATAQPKLHVDSPVLSVAGEWSSWEISKLKLRRDLRARGLEAAFDTLLGSLPASARAEYAEAHTLRTDDPAFAAAMNAFGSTTGCGEFVLSDILRAAAI